MLCSLKSFRAKPSKPMIKTLAAVFCAITEKEISDKASTFKKIVPVPKK